MKTTFKKFLEFIKKLWDKLNGSKTALSVVAMMILKAIQIFFPSLLPAEAGELFNDILLFLAGGVGVGHKLIKKYSK